MIFGSLINGSPAYPISYPIIPDNTRFCTGYFGARRIQPDRDKRHPIGGRLAVGWQGIGIPLPGGPVAARRSGRVLREGLERPALSADETVKVSPWPGAGGEGILQVPRVMNRRYGLMMQKGSMPCPAPRRGGCNGGALAAPLPRLRYYTAHLALMQICDSELNQVWFLQRDEPYVRFEAAHLHITRLVLKRQLAQERDGMMSLSILVVRNSEFNCDCTWLKGRNG